MNTEPLLQIDLRRSGYTMLSSFTPTYTKDKTEIMSLHWFAPVIFAHRLTSDESPCDSMAWLHALGKAAKPQCPIAIPALATSPLSSCTFGLPCFRVEKLEFSSQWH